jgi:hypothetical protein
MGALASFVGWRDAIPAFGAGAFLFGRGSPILAIVASAGVGMILYCGINLPARSLKADAQRGGRRPFSRLESAVPPWQRVETMKSRGWRLLSIPKGHRCNLEVYKTLLISLASYVNSYRLNALLFRIPERIKRVGEPSSYRPEPGIYLEYSNCENF